MRCRYEQLRDSTRQTTIEVMDQARDYVSEFYRLRRCLLPSTRIPFTYVVPPGEEPREVLLVGDFTQWREHVCGVGASSCGRLSVQVDLDGMREA